MSGNCPITRQTTTTQVSTDWFLTEEALLWLRLTLSCTLTGEQFNLRRWYRLLQAALVRAQSRRRDEDAR